jgi:hypothetical protein
VWRGAHGWTGGGSGPRGAQPEGGRGWGCGRKGRTGSAEKGHAMDGWVPQFPSHPLPFIISAHQHRPRTRMCENRFFSITPRPFPWYPIVLTCAPRVLYTSSARQQWRWVGGWASVWGCGAGVCERVAGGGLRQVRGGAACPGPPPCLQSSMLRAGHTRAWRAAWKGWRRQRVSRSCQAWLACPGRKTAGRSSGREQRARRTPTAPCNRPSGLRPSGRLLAARPITRR